MNIALIGTGMVAGTHVAAINGSALPLSLRGVLGRNRERTQAFATTHQTQAFQSVEDIAADDAVDFVIVATPPDARHDIVQALTAAKKPILMEKPVERNLKAATEIVELCEAADIPLGIVFQHRARAASAALKAALSVGKLGDIVSVDLRVPWWRDQSYYDVPGRGSYSRDGGGVMISQAIHTLDLAIWLLGPVLNAQAMMRQTAMHQLEAEDWASALFEMECGAVGTLMATTAAWPGDAETISVQGTRAAAHLGSGVLTINHLDGRTETFGASASTGGGADPMAFTHEWHQNVIEDFARAIQDQRPPMASGREVLQTHAVIDAMERASKSNHREEVVI